MSQAKRSSRRRAMSPVHPHAAAIDIGATLHVAAVGPDRDPEPVRSFGTFTADLHRLADWLERCGVRTVAMESTGVYWIPAYEVLEQRGFAVVLVNARDARHVPGRKTDVSDAEWLRRLHEHELLRASFHPEARIAALRDDLRQRERLLDYAAAHIQHMQKALTQMNLQLQHVVAVGRTETALGAFYRRLSGRVGKAKAVTATARKIAVLFYNALRHGMAYADPGASYYEERYKQRVLANLRRRAKSLGYVLQATGSTPPVAAVSY
jgi:hypothetical protein